MEGFVSYGNNVGGISVSCIFSFAPGKVKLGSIISHSIIFQRCCRTWLVGDNVVGRIKFEEFYVFFNRLRNNVRLRKFDNHFQVLIIILYERWIITAFW